MPKNILARQRRPSAFPPDMVIYQIYPRSFKDSNGDGIGDLAGICSKLDYLEDLGVTAIWLSPVNLSPMVDGGYDVADYCAIDPMFGTLDDLDDLVAEAHKRHIRIIFDLVVNHTSDQHPWFMESRRSRDNPKRDWYVWKSPRANGRVPNNWLSAFGGSVWEFDAYTNQYYLHSFAKAQPDLNWENPAVRGAIKDVMRFWLDRGVDGFRIDSVYLLSKDPKFRSDLKNPGFDPKKQTPYEAMLHAHSKRGAKLYAYLKELSDVAKSYGDRMLITEAYPHRRFGYSGYLRFYEKIDPNVLAPFNFEGIFLPWDAAAYKKYIDGFQSRLQSRYVPVYALGNHDKPRIATRVGKRATRTASLLLLTLPGVPVMYYGDEIGMANVPTSTQHSQDLAAQSVSGPDGNRDPERTPMQWSARPHAGFSSAKPWLPVASNFQTQNIEHETAQPQSLLNLYKKLLDFRAKSDALKHGAYKPLRLNHPDLFGFMRITKHEKLAIVLNFSKTVAVPLDIPGKMLLSTHAQTSPSTLEPLEGRIIAVSTSRIKRTPKK
jgi:alpha-glucosidase